MLHLLKPVEYFAEFRGRVAQRNAFEAGYLLGYLRDLAPADSVQDDGGRL